MSTCRKPGCSKPVEASNLCSEHYHIECAVRAADDACSKAFRAFISLPEHRAWVSAWWSEHDESDGDGPDDNTMPASLKGTPEYLAYQAADAARTKVLEELVFTRPETKTTRRVRIG